MAISITPAPTLPSLSSPSTFNTRALALHSWMTTTFISELEGISSEDIANEGRLIGVQIFTASGTYTPTSTAKYAMVEMHGAGGGGGNGNSSTGEVGAGSGGNAGNYYSALLDVSGIGTSTVAVGSGGTGGASGGASGSDGGNTTWADGTTSITCYGGTGGVGCSTQAATFANNANANNTANSVTAGANLVQEIADVSGDHAQVGFVIDADLAVSTHGGSSRFGRGGRSQPRNNTGINLGAAGDGYGSGGGGGSSKGAQTGGSDGGDGSGGYVVITEFTE